MGAYRGFGRLNLQKNVRKALIAGSTFQVSVAIQWEIQTCAAQPFLWAVFTATHTSSTLHILWLPKL
jgi:hypothetical protein